MLRLKSAFLALCFCISLSNLLAQGVAINTDGSDPDSTAALDISSTSRGVLLPRMTAVQKTAISGPATGLMIYQTDGTAGYYYYDGAAWLLVGDPVVPSGSTILSDSPTNTGLTDNGFSLIGKTTLSITPFLDSADSWSAINTVGAPTARSNHHTYWTGTEMIIWGGYLLADGALYDPDADTWTAMTDAPDTRSYTTTAWTGTEMIYWGGRINGSGQTNTGYRYDPSADTWTSMSTTNAPSARYYASAIWTGTEMIVWGGIDYMAGGARYNPSTDTWTTMSSVGMPETSNSPEMVWTGDKMLVWSYDEGGLYDPVSDTWTTVTSTNGPTSGCKLIWGDNTAFSYRIGEFKEYDPSSDTWTDLTSPSIPNERYSSTLVWDGDELNFWGGVEIDGMDETYYNTGAFYDPTTATWTNMTETNAPEVRSQHSAVWTGTEMIIWGGIDASYNSIRTGAIYYGPREYGTATSTTYYLYEKD